MPRAARPWFRFYVEAVHDRKLRRLPPAERWLWVATLAAARQSPIPGALMVSVREPMTFDDLADFAGVPLEVVERAFPRFEQSEMVEHDQNLGAWAVKNWADRQYESDTSTERVRKSRSLERSNGVTGTFVVTPPETEAETDPPSPRRATEAELEAEAVRRLKAAEKAGTKVNDTTAFRQSIVKRLRREGWQPERRPAVRDLTGCSSLPREDAAPMPTELRRALRSVSS